MCVIGHDCNEVLNSSFAYLFGIRTAYIGLVFYLVIAFISLTVVLSNIRLWFLPIFIFAIMAVALSLYLIWVQWRIVRKWCAHCLYSALINILILSALAMLFI